MNNITTNSNIAIRVITAPAVTSKAVVPFAFRVIILAYKASTPAAFSGSNCFICGSPDHFAKDYPNGKQVRFTPRVLAAPGQISKVYDDEEEDPPVDERVDSENE